MWIRRTVTFLMRDRRGFTLLETVLAIGLAMILLVTVFDLSWRVWTILNISSERFNEDMELNMAVQWITRDLRRAETVNIAMPGRLEIGVGGGKISYVLDGNLLVRTENDTTRKILLKDLTEVNFSAEERKGGVLVAVELKRREGSVRSCVWVYNEK